MSIKLDLAIKNKEGKIFSVGEVEFENQREYDDYKYRLTEFGLNCSIADEHDHQKYKKACQTGANYQYIYVNPIIHKDTESSVPMAELALRPPALIRTLSREGNDND